MSLERHPATESESRRQWSESLFDTPDGIVWEADASLAFTFVSRQAETLLGYPPERWLSDPTFGMERVHADDRERVRELLSHDLSGLGCRSFECRMVAADGRVLWFKNLVSVEARGCTASKWRGMLIDITHSKETEISLRQEVQGYRQIAETAQQGIWRIDNQARILFVNRKMAGLLGYSDEELRGRCLYELMDPATEQSARAGLTHSRQGDREQHDLVFLRKDGTKVWTTVAITPLHDDQGRDSGSIAVVSDVSAQRRSSALLAAQRSVFELLVRDEPDSLHKALHKLVRSIEDVVDGVTGSVLLLDADGERIWVGAAPSLPPAYNRAVHGAKIGPQAGSCGTAAFRKELVITPDIETDPLWTDYRHTAREHGLRACWSSPILNRSGRVLGTFGMYFREVRRPTEDELQFVQDATAAAALVIEHVQTRESLDTNISLLEATLDATADGILVVDNNGTIQRYNRRFQEQWKIPDELMKSHDADRVLAFCVDQIKEPSDMLQGVLDFGTRRRRP